MASKNLKKRLHHASQDEEANDHDSVVYILSLTVKENEKKHQRGPRNVGVYSSKIAAAEAVGNFPMDDGKIAFDDMIWNYNDTDPESASYFLEESVRDYRKDPPDHGVLLAVCDDFGWYVMNIDKFTVQGSGKKTTINSSTSQKVAAEPPPAKKPKGEAPSEKSMEVNKREIDDAALMVILQDVMKPAEHKRVSSKIQNLVEKMESAAVPLRNTREHIFGGDNVQPENLFEVHVGDFWGMFDTRNYMRAHLALADEIHDKIAVIHPDIQAAWEIVLWHYQELLRLSSSDNLGLRYRFPFLLLRLQRDDDAFCFIRYWIQDDNERQELHKTSKQGDWLYGHEKDSRFLDIFKACPKANFDFVSLPLLVALACIKMRIMAATTTTAKLKEQQQKQADQILKLIHKRNPTMLLALVNPTPLLSQPAPDYLSRGTPSECYSIVENASSIWNQIPGALKRLQKQFGERPTFDCKLEYMNY